MAVSSQSCRRVLQSTVCDEKWPENKYWLVAPFQTTRAHGGIVPKSQKCRLSALKCRYSAFLHFFWKCLLSECDDKHITYQRRLWFSYTLGLYIPKNTTSRVSLNSQIGRKFFRIFSSAKSSEKMTKLGQKMPIFGISMPIIGIFRDFEKFSVCASLITSKERVKLRFYSFLSIRSTFKNPARNFWKLTVTSAPVLTGWPL